MVAVHVNLPEDGSACVLSREFLVDRGDLDARTTAGGVIVDDDWETSLVAVLGKASKIGLMARDFLHLSKLIVLLWWCCWKFLDVSRFLNSGHIVLLLDTTVTLNTTGVEDSANMHIVRSYI